MPPTRGVQFKFYGDKTRKRYLRYDFVSTERLEDELGLSGMEEALTKAGHLSSKFIVGLVWCGLLHDEPDLTRDEVRKNLDYTKVKEIVLAVVAAYRKDTGQEEKEEEGEEEGKAEAPPA